MGQKPGIKDQLLLKSVTRWAKKGRAFHLAIALAVGGVLATGFVAIYTFDRVQQRPAESSPSPRDTTPAIEAVTALGRLEPTGEVIRVSAPMSMQGGPKVEQLLVSKGDRVRAEQVIAILDNRDRLQAAVELAQKQVEITKANLERVKAGAKVGAIQAQQATINRLEKELAGEKDAQQTKINRLETQLKQTKHVQDATIEAQKATLRRLEAELGNVRGDLARYQQLVEDGVISESELESRRLRVTTAEERLSEAQANLIQAQANQVQTLSTINEQLTEAQVIRRKTIDVIEAQIKEAEATLEEIKEVRPVDIQTAEAEVESALAAVEQAQKDLQSAYVKAPRAGQILAVNTRPGETVDEQKGIVYLGETEEMMVVAEVYESDIRKVRLGQRVIVTSESKAFEGQLRGTVSEIGLQIGKKDILDTDPAAAVDARVVEVNIRLHPEQSKEVAGLTNSKVIVEIFL